MNISSLPKDTPSKILQIIRLSKIDLTNKVTIKLDIEMFSTWFCLFPNFKILFFHFLL